MEQRAGQSFQIHTDTPAQLGTMSSHYLKLPRDSIGVRYVNEVALRVRFGEALECMSADNDGRSE